jgi:glycerol-3-phosphate acyltransferase PlsX
MSHVSVLKPVEVECPEWGGSVLVERAVAKKQMDYSEHGGAPFLGISKPVIKAHGSSNARSISFCVLQAKNYAASGIIDEFYKLAQDKEKYIKGAK